MSTNPKITEIEVAPDEARATASTAGGFKMFNRVLDWITSDRMQLINITDRINEIVRKSGVRDGIVHLQSLHTTTAVFLNEWQDALLQDVKRFLDDVVALPMRPVRAADLGIGERVARDVGGAVADPAERERLLLGHPAWLHRVRLHRIGVHRVPVERSGEVVGLAVVERVRPEEGAVFVAGLGAARQQPEDVLHLADEALGHVGERRADEHLDLPDLAEHPA